MFVSTYPLIYFAFPKCATEWLRRELRLRPNNKFSPNGWEYCHINYTHVKPKTWLDHHQPDTSKFRMFTIVRNTYARLVSAWAYGKKLRLPYAKDKTFAEFIQMIYDKRDHFLNLPYCWMYMPFDMYFEGVIDNVNVFHVEDLPSFIDFFQSHFQKRLKNYVVNKTAHDPIDSYYTPDLVEKVNEVYKYEILRFGFTMSSS